MKNKKQLVFGLLFSLAAITASAQSNNQSLLDQIGAEQVVTCLYVTGKFSMANDQMVSTVSKTIFNVYNPISSSIPSALAENLGSAVANKLSAMSPQEQLQMVIDCGNDPRVKPLWSK